MASPRKFLLCFVLVWVVCFLPEECHYLIYICRKELFLQQEWWAVETCQKQQRLLEARCQSVGHHSAGGDGSGSDRRGRERQALLHSECFTKSPQDLLMDWRWIQRKKIEDTSQVFSLNNWKKVMPLLSQVLGSSELCTRSIWSPRPNKNTFPMHLPYQMQFLNMHTHDLCCFSFLCLRVKVPRPRAGLVLLSQQSGVLYDKEFLHASYFLQGRIESCCR